MAVINFPDPAATNPNTGNPNSDGWYNSGNGVTYQYSNGLWTAANDTSPFENIFVDVDGDTMTGALELPADPTSALEASTKQYVDNEIVTAINTSESTNALLFLRRDSAIGNQSVETTGYTTFANSIGIGTIPTTALHISGTNANSSRLTVQRGLSKGEVGVINDDLLLAGTGTGSNGGITFYSGGSPTARLDETGKFGIGTTTPRSNLYVSSSTEYEPSLTYTDGSLCNFQYIGVHTSLGISKIDPYPFYIQNKDNSGNARNISLNPLGGRVGIGTASPSVQLTVNGDLKSTNLDVTGRVVLTSGSNWNYAGFNIKRAESNVGVAKQIAFLLDGDVEGDTELTNYLNIWGTYSGAPTTDSTSTGLSASMNLGAPNEIIAHTNKAARVRIDSSGNVGIGNGTTGPVAKVDIRNGNVHVMPSGKTPWQSDATSQNSGLYLGQDGRIWGYRLSDGADDPFKFYTVDKNTGARTTDFVLTKSGNVGIGTFNDPNLKLDIQGSPNTNDLGELMPRESIFRISKPGVSSISYPSVCDFAIKRYEVDGVRARTQLDFNLTNDNSSTPDETVMSLRSNGNVGIGEEEPAYTLHVDGDLFAKNFRIDQLDPI